jgi:type II secretory pathway component GspD/PulD (secretin)
MHREKRRSILSYSLLATGVFFSVAGRMYADNAARRTDAFEIVRATNTVLPNRVDVGADPASPAPLTADMIAAAAEQPPPESLLIDDDRVLCSEGQTVFDSVMEVVDQIPYRLNYMDLTESNDLARIRSEPASFWTAKPTPWKTVLRELVSPHGLDFLEDGEIIRIGTERKIAAARKELARDTLERNRTAIEVNFEGGTQLYIALRTIQSCAGISINYDYMAPQDRNAPMLTASAPTADETSAAQPVGKTTTYVTQSGQPQEWRIVLREVLEPNGYEFLEKDGVVRIGSPSQIEQWRREEIDELPVVNERVRIFHASPEDIIDQLTKLKDRGELFKHSRSFAVLLNPDTRDTAHSKRFPGGSVSISASGEGEQMGGDVGDIGSFGSMNRPRVPPSILIGDVEENLEAIIAQIRALDVRERQVLIEAKIFEVTEGSARELGINWENLSGGGSFVSGVEYSRSWQESRINTANRTDGYEDTYELSKQEDLMTDQTTSESHTRDYSHTDTESKLNTFDRIYDSFIQGGFTSILNPLEFNFYWQAIQTADDFEMISQPSLVIGDHSEAVIRVGIIEPAYRRVETYPENNQNVAVSYEWQMIQTGIALWVVPEISPDQRMVRLSIHPQDSDVTGYVTVGTGDEGGRYPVLAIREIDTRVSVPSGYTLMLGGLIDSNKGDEERKVPLLGDIPLLGRLFRWNSKGRDARNLIILMTPTILDDDNPNTGYERPAQPFTRDLLRGLGRDLGNPVPDVNEKDKVDVKGR